MFSIINPWGFQANSGCDNGADTTKIYANNAVYGAITAIDEDKIISEFLNESMKMSSILTTLTKRAINNR